MVAMPVVAAPCELLSSLSLSFWWRLDVVVMVGVAGQEKNGCSRNLLVFVCG
jgi:hypothetical protein